jgi:PilZ domain
MGVMAVDRSDLPEAARGDGEWRPRRYARCSMFKPAHVVLEDAVLDCVLLDLSPGGAQIYLLARAELPDSVVLWLPGGESRPMRRRWQQGSHIGFEAMGDAVPLS